MQFHQVNTPPVISYPGVVPRSQIDQHAASDFPQRLAALRRQRGLTQQQLADRVGVHAQQLKRYEAGASQPTLDVIRNLAVALGTTSDYMLFDKEERGPDDDLRLQFEAVSRFDAEDRKTARALLDGLILRHEAKRMTKAEQKH
jgi:transcriptional regulator with XRE-family HTH domain